MRRVKDIYHDLKEHYKRFGLIKTWIVYLEFALNKFIYIDFWNVITLACEEVRCPEGVDLSKLSCRFASYKDLLIMQKQQIWEIDEEKFENFHIGDQCLLSYVNDRLAGYTWIHTKGEPLLQAGLRLKVPDQYIYNYAAFTLSNFRGQKLQSYRHFILCTKMKPQNIKYLFGYVKYTNWGSRYGQNKSGYKPIGKMLLIGTKKKYIILFSKKLRDLGVKRIPV